MRTAIYTISLLLLLNAFGFSQEHRGALERLNNQIRTAQDLLRQFPDAEAKKLIDNAVEQRNQAEIRFNKRNMLKARVHMRSARSYVERAIHLLSAKPVERIQRQVDDLIEQAKVRLTGKKSTQANRLLGQARDNRRLGQIALGKQQVRKAMEHFRIAKFYAERSIGMVNMTGNKVTRETMSNEKDRYEALYKQASDQTSTCDNPQAIKLIAQAEQQYRNILKAISNGNNRVALNLYYSNTRLLLRAMDLCQGISYSLKEEAIEAVAIFGDLVQSLQDTQAKNVRTDPAAERIDQLYQRAQQALSDQRYRIAIRQARLGRNLINRLLNTGQESLLEETVWAELDRLNEEIDRLEQESRDNKSGLGFPLLQAARISADKAEQLLQSGRVRISLEIVYAGNRFINTARAVDSYGQITPELVKDRMAQLEANVNAMKARELQNNAREFVDQAGEMLKNARQAYRNNEHIVANEYIKIGLNLLEKAEM